MAGRYGGLREPTHCPQVDGLWPPACQPLEDFEVDFELLRLDELELPELDEPPELPLESLFDEELVDEELSDEGDEPLLAGAESVLVAVLSELPSLLPEDPARLSVR